LQPTEIVVASRKRCNDKVGFGEAAPIYRARRVVALDARFVCLSLPCAMMCAGVPLEGTARTFGECPEKQKYL
jgi:hypothetical protein